MSVRGASSDTGITHHLVTGASSHTPARVSANRARADHGQRSGGETRGHHRRQGPAQWTGPEGRPARRCSPSRPATAQVTLGDVRWVWGYRDGQRDGQAGAPDLRRRQCDRLSQNIPFEQGERFPQIRHIPQVGSAIPLSYRYGLGNRPARSSTAPSRTKSIRVE